MFGFSTSYKNNNFYNKPFHDDLIENTITSVSLHTEFEHKKLETVIENAALKFNLIIFFSTKY